MTPQELASGLDYFIGTEQYHAHFLNRKLVYTDGVKYFATHAKAYWFIDAIAIGVHGRKAWVPYIVPAKTDFAVIIMKVANGEARVDIYQDYPGTKLSGFKTPTDAPEGTWKFYLQLGYKQVVMMLPSEY